MMISAFGVEHGDEVSKAKKKDDGYGGHGAPSAGRRVLAGSFPTIHGAVAGKKGKKLRAAGNQFLGAEVGGLAGFGVGAATRNPTAASLGGLAGAVGGSQVGLNRNQRKGYLKREDR